MTSPTASEFSVQSGDSHLVRLDLTDEDVIDAMRHIPGYLDISTDDFRVLYQFASEHAIAGYSPTCRLVT